MSQVNRNLEGAGTGTSVPTTIGFARAMQRFGGNPKTPESLRRFLGLSGKQGAKKWQEIIGTPVGHAALKGYITAARKGDGPGEMRYLGQLLKGHVHVLHHVFHESGLDNLGPDLAPRAEAAFLGTSLGNTLALRSGTKAYGSGSAGAGAAGMPNADTFSAIAKAAKANGVPLDVAMAVFAKESGFRNIRGPGTSTGIGQVKAAVLTDYNKAHKTNYSRADLLKNVSLSADVSMWDLNRVHKQVGGSWARGYEGYHYGPGGGVSAADEAKFSSYRKQYADVAQGLSLQGRSAVGDAAAMVASRWADKEAHFAAEAASKIGSGVSAAFKGVADAADKVTKAFDVLAQSSATLHRENERASQRFVHSFGQNFGTAPGHPHSAVK